VAATGRRLARMAGRLAASDDAFANAHRVLGSGGVILRASETDARRCRRLLEAEGVRFRGRAADPARRVGVIDLRGRLSQEEQPSPPCGGR
jgi:alkylated DNA nucleotide flippase Atl1